MIGSDILCNKLYNPKYKISVIIPIYNAEKYLDRCINSILKQSVSNFQVVLINDGSTDISLSICYKYAKRHNNIVVFSKTNGGVSSARNKGIELAEGEYLGFVDPDDWVHEDMYFDLYNIAKENNTNIVLCNYINKHIERDELITDFENSVIEDKKFIIKSLIPGMISPDSLNSNTNAIKGSVWRMLVKRQFIENKNIRFNEGIPLMEDLLFLISALLNVEKISLSNSHYYIYNNQEETEGNKYRHDYYEIVKKVYYRLENLLQVYYCFPEIESHMNNRYIKMIINSISNETRRQNKKSIHNRYLEIKRIVNDNRVPIILSRIDKKDLNIKNKLIIYFLAGKNNLIIFILFNMFHKSS